MLVVARGHDVADVTFVAHEHDAASFDFGDFGNPPHDGKQNVPEIEARRKGLGDFQDHLRIALAALESVEVFTNTKLTAEPSNQLGRAKRLAHEVVGPGGVSAG